MSWNNIENKLRYELEQWGDKVAGNVKTYGARKVCGRCGNPVDDGDWWNGWPNYGMIKLGFAAQAFTALCGDTFCTQEHIDAAERGHPAMTKYDPQKVVFEWGELSPNNYRLCSSCQRELLGIVGKFFGVSK